MTKEQMDAVAWAVNKLQPCYRDSLKAIRAGVLALSAQDNIEQYEELVKLNDGHERWRKG